MLSGANLLNYRKRYTTKQYIKKRVIRVVIPFIIWSGIWFLYYRYISDRPLLEKNFFNGLVYDKIQPVFWYFYSLLGIYAVIPILSLIVKKVNRRLILFSIISWLFLVGCISYYYGIIGQPAPTLFTSIPLLSTSALGYFLLGWYFKTFPPKSKPFFWLLIAGTVSLIVMIALTLILLYERHYTVTTVYTVFGLFGMMYGIATFIIFQKLFASWQPSARLATLLRNLSSASLGIYCIHEFFIFFAEDVLKLADGSYFHMIILPIVVYVICTLIVLGVKKLPGSHFIF